jgi:hypothetical protein
VIISASYRTDIPAFYGRWFMNRLGAGYCLAVNPYNHKAIRISLARGAVDGFVFWTKNLGPFAKFLPEIREKGYPFVVQYAINGYPRELERAVVDWDRSARIFVETARRFGPRVCVWRYDTIVITSLTPAAWHVERFERIAEKLSGATDEVIISFAQIYAKTRRNMDEAAGEFGFTWTDISDEAKCGLAEKLVKIAERFGMKLSICAQKKYVVTGAQAASCVDARRLEEVGGVKIDAKRKGNRPECGCFESRDIGDYDTCPHGCVYCYGVRNLELARERYRAHDPESEYLLRPAGDCKENIEYSSPFGDKPLNFE